MLVITEHNSRNGNFYSSDLMEEDELIYSRKVHLRTATVKHPNGNVYFTLYDNEMIPIKEAFQYINFELADKSPNSKVSAFSALKLLYSFLNLFGLEIETLTEQNIKQLKIFLRGISPKGNHISLNTCTQRSSETINGYLGCYRSFFSFLEITNSPLFKKSLKTYTIVSDYCEKEVKITGYKLQEKVNKDMIRVPKYISVKDFTNIFQVIKKDYTLREECIVRLMYESGLRIGEVLGLTSEDIVQETTENGDIYAVYIRNRLSDKPFQLAKTCMKVTHKSQYYLKEYNSQGYGYQKVIINETLYDKLNEYINLAHTSYKEKFLQNYNKYTITDIVTEWDLEDENYYIFINNVAKPLTANLWNQTARDIFKNANIKLDKNKRCHNLNHRFRHGFAMFMVQYKNIKAFDLKILMRHASIHSVYKYYNPTDEDISKLKDSFVRSLYEIIPELKL